MNIFVVCRRIQSEPLEGAERRVPGRVRVQQRRVRPPRALGYEQVLASERRLPGFGGGQTNRQTGVRALSPAARKTHAEESGETGSDGWG